MFPSALRSKTATAASTVLRLSRPKAAPRWLQQQQRQNRRGIMTIASHTHNYNTGNTNNKKVSSTHNRPQKRNMFIQTESTPNPESIKFLPGRPVLQNTSTPTTTGFYITRTDPPTEISRSPLAKLLLSELDGIKSIYLGEDFITLTKYVEAKWDHIRTPAFAAIMDYYAKDPDGKGILSDEPIVSDTTILEDDDEVVAMIKELLETRIRPAVQEDGGDIRYVGFEEVSGIVKVQLAGSCVGCPSSSVTLKNGVENMLMHYIPEVTGVEAIEEEEEGDGGDLGDVVVESTEKKKAKTYEERLAAAGIPFSD